MEILFVGTLEPHPGGSGTVNSQVVRGLARRGHRIRGVAPMAVDVVGTYDDAANFSGIDLNRYPVEHAETEPQRSDSHHATAELNGITSGLRRFADWSPDVVLAGRESFMRYLPDALPWPDAPPIVAIAHSTIADGALDDEMVATNPLTANLRERLTGCARLIMVARHAAPLYEPLGVPIDIIPNGIELDVFQPPPDAHASSPRADEVTVLHASNLKEAKRPLDFNAAAAKALAVRPDLRFIVGGEGPYRVPMEAAAAADGTSFSFEFTGWIPRSAMPALYGRSDIVVLTSDREVMPCVILEAMACGRVVVASDIAATLELVDDGRTGFTYPMGDVDRLAEILVSLADEPELRIRVGRAARVAARTHDIERTIDGYEQALFSVIAGTRPSAGTDPQLDLVLAS